MITLNCTLSEDGLKVNCNGTEFDEVESPLTYKDEWFWIYIGIYCILVILAGVFSGLTLGLLSMDTTSLQVLIEAGTPKQQKNARRIMPLVKRHHLLLVTLLLANAAAVESMPLFLDRVSDPLTAILVSVTAVLFFGEVFPQALCSRFGLSIGATLAPFVYFLMAITFVISWPLSKLLDCLLGKEHGTFFRRAELKALVDLHGPPENAKQEESPLSYDEVLIIKGALEMRDKVVEDAMVPLGSVFMLNIDARMDKATMNEVLRATHSRVPVYEKSRETVIGFILVKTLIMLDPDDAVPVRRVIQRSKCFRKPLFTVTTTPLYDLLNEFQKGKGHLFLVTEPSSSPESFSMVEPNCVNFSDEPPGKVIGIITLEDVLEELLLAEIIDETDVYVDVHNRIRVARAMNFQYSISDAESTRTNRTAPAVRGSGRGRLYRPNLLSRATSLVVSPSPDLAVTDREAYSDNPRTPLLDNNT